MKDLLISSVTPVLSSGTGLRTYGVAAALARHREVELAYCVFDGERPATPYQELSRLRTRPLRPTRGPRRGWAYMQARRRGVPADLARGVSAELAGAGARADPSDRVIADGPVVAAALLPLARTRPVVYLAHNLESGFREQGPELESFERRVLVTFAESWMATRADERGALALAGGACSTRYVPNVVDLARLAPVSPAGEPVMLLVGDFTYAPNRQGLRYACEEVLPIVWATRPQVRLLVAGRGLERPLGEPRVQGLGFVEDLRSAYARAALVLVPLLRGGGSPLKFIEAMARGLPVVATQHAGRLLEDAISSEHFLQGATPAELAHAIVRLLDDQALARRIGSAGRELVARSYSVDTLASLLAP